MKQQPIGVFDSGRGGLSILKALAKALPNERVIYIADKVNFPYGRKSRSFIIKRSLEIALSLEAQDCKLLISACGTISSVALVALKEAIRVPIIDTITPMINNLAPHPKQTVGVIGTPNTIACETHQRMLKEKHKKTRVFAQGCPSLASLAEYACSDKELIHNTISEEAARIPPTVAFLVLGCTHYSLLETYFHLHFPTAKIVDPALAIAKETRKMLLGGGKSCV